MEIKMRNHRLDNWGSSRDGGQETLRGRLGMLLGALLLSIPALAFPLAKAGYPELALAGVAAGFGAIVLGILYAFVWLFWRKLLKLAVIIALCCVPL
jgi:hypothetical protein